jgi:hypothetical protein
MITSVAPQLGQKPLQWVLLKFVTPTEQATKILSSIYEMGASSWRLSSDIETVTQDDTNYYVTTLSGSTYTLPKGQIGMSDVTQDIYQHMQQLSVQQPEAQMTITLFETSETIVPILETYL